jgi:hypothetical protein
MGIQDNPSFKDLASAGKGFEYLAPLAPIADLFGDKGRVIADALRQGAELAKQAAELGTLPDRFNQHYRARGWIAFAEMHHEGMEEAVRLAEAGDLDAGEAALVRVHDAQRLEFMVSRLNNIRAFHPRRDLVELALQDHLAGRYHASVPVFLAQIDGLVFDIAGKGFYETREKELRHLEAKNTISGHADGLMALATEMSRNRRQTTTSVLSLPYRNGILHGRDLGYGDEVTSLKAICALAALSEWARAHEAGRAQIEPPLEWLDPDTATWDDVRRLWGDLIVTLRNRPNAI